MTTPSHDAGAVSVSGLAVTFTGRAGETDAVRDISFTLPPGQFAAIVGPSGCGKSTVLNVIAGLLTPSAGSAQVDGRTVQGVNTSVGYLFQRDALLPWKTALKNVTLPLICRGVGEREANARAREWIARVGLTGFENHYPHQLSGGMKKRASLATVFVNRPRVLLMDEPFSALDVQTRDLMENELLGIWLEERPTVLFVTHDLEEAIGLADRVLVLTARPGRMKSDYAIALPRPRALMEVRFEEAFQQQYKRIWGDLREEVLAAYQSKGEGLT